MVDDDGQNSWPIVNLIGMNEILMVHSSLKGVIRIARTESIRIKGREEESNLVVGLLRSDNIQVVANGTVIMDHPDFNAEMVDRIPMEMDIP